MKREEFRNLIKESIGELLNPNILNEDSKKIKFKQLIKKLIRENIQTKKDKKTKEDSYDPQDVKDRVSQEKERDEGKSFKDILNKLKSVAKSIDSKVIVSFDDHKDFNVEVPQAFRVRISPRWENNFDVEAFVESNDRIKVIGLTLDQVCDFIKENFTDKVKDNVKKALDKVEDNKKDKTKKSDSGMDNYKGVKESDKSKKVVKLPKKEEDSPGAPMKEIDTDELKKQKEYKEFKPTPPKHKLDKELIKRMPGKKK